MTPRPVVPVLGALVALVVVVTPGTLARWSATGAVQPASVRSGALDLTVDDRFAGPGGSGTAVGLGLSSVVPGESVAARIPVGNAGSTPLVYRVSGSASGALAPGLVFTVVPGGVASNTGTAAGGTRRGTCSGTPTYSGALGGTPVVVVPARPALAEGGGEQVCVVVGLSPTAPSSMQGASGAGLLVFHAAQVGAP